MSYILNIDLSVSKELAKLHYDIDATKNLIDHIFVFHKNDKDTSLFDSIPWEKYMNDYKELSRKYIEKKKEVSDIVRSYLYEINPDYKDKNFSWSVEDFQTGSIKISVEE